jgi:putative ABC transport system substrate-binding protein
MLAQVGVWVGSTQSHFRTIQVCPKDFLAGQSHAERCSSPNVPHGRWEGRQELKEPMVMRRREVISLLGGAAVTLPIVARAQQARKLPTIGFLGTATATASGWTSYTASFEQRLRELGWIEGRTVAIEYRWGEGRRERFAEIAAEFVRRKVDVIVTGGSAVSAIKQVTTDIPIVFAIATDPVGGDIVASLARPGGNVTGLSNQSADTAGKRLEILQQVLPNLRRLAILANADYRESVLEMGEVQDAARKFGMEVAKLEIRRAEDIVPAFESLNRQADALYVVADGLVATNFVHIIALALAARLPTIGFNRAYAAGGTLISYGPSFPDLFRRTADYVDKILRGAKPADLPVEQPTKFELIINLKTAKALGLEVPATLLARADEVIE